MTLHSSTVHDSLDQPLSGGDVVLNFHRLFGDSDGDGDVDSTDLAAFRAAFLLRAGQAGYRACFDFNGDGVIDMTDYGQFRLRLGTSI